MYAGLISIQIMGKNFHTGGDSDIVSYRNILRSDSIYFDITIDKKSAVDIKNVLSDFFLNGGGDK